MPSEIRSVVPLQDQTPTGPRPLDQAGFERLLAEEGIVYEPSPYHPQDVDVHIFKKEGLTDEQIAELSQVLEIIKEFLEGPLIIDQFSDHRSRRDWRKKIEDAYGEDFKSKYEKNRLRLNKVAQVTGVIGVVKRWGLQWDKFPEYEEVYRSVPLNQSYDALPIEQKKEFVSHLSALAFDLYQRIAHEAETAK